MDAETIVASGLDGSSIGGDPTAAVPAVRNKASPSFEDEDDVEDSDFEKYEVVGDDEAVEENGVEKSSGSSSSSKSSSSSSESSDDDGGFVSGEEDFDTAAERPIVVEKGLEEEEEEEMEAAFGEPPETLRPIAKLSEDELDDEDEDVVNLVETGKEDALEENEVELNSVVAPEIVELIGKQLVLDEDGIGDGIKNGIELKETSILSEVIADSVEAVLKPVGEGLVEVDGLKFTTEGDSVVEAINVDVNVNEPGVVVVEDGKPEIEVSSMTEKLEEESSVVDEVKEREIAEDFESKEVEYVDEEKSVEITSGHDDLIVEDGVKVTSEGDAVVNAVHVDLKEPGVVVVDRVEETTEVSAVEVEEVHVDRSLTAEEQEDSSQNLNSSENEVLLVATEDDSVKEAKESEVEGEAIHVNGLLSELEEDSSLMLKPADDDVVVDGVKFTAEGGSVVEAVHLNVSEPGVALVDDVKEDNKPEVKVVDVHSDEIANDDNDDNLETGTSADETQAVNDAVQSARTYTASVANEDDDDKSETGIDVVANQIVNEVNQSSHSYNAFIDEDLDGAESADDEIKRFLEEARGMDGSGNEEDTDDVIFAGSEAAKQYLEQLERGSVGDSPSGGESSRDHSQMIDGQIVSDSDEEVDTDEEGGGKELFDSAALAALLKAATGGGSDGGNVTISSQDGSRLFSIDRPAGLGSSLRARAAPRQVQSNLFSASGLASRAEADNLSEEEKKKLDSIQQLRVKFLRLVQRLGQSAEDSIAAQVLYRLVLVAGRPSSPAFSFDAAKMTAQELESQGKNDLDFSLNILVIGKTGVGKSALINSIFGEKKVGMDAFEPATTAVKAIKGVVDAVHIRVFDTPGLKTSVMDQGTNRKILAQVKKATKKFPPDIVLYVDRLDSQTRDLNDLPLLRTISSSLGTAIWRSAIFTLTHAASAPPDGPSGAPLSYEVFVAQRSHALQQSIGQAVGDLRLMNPSLMNPVSLAENHPSCRKNRDGLTVLPNGQAWRPQLLMFCYSMKILSEATALFKQQDPFDHQKLFGFRMRAPPLPYLLSWLLQSRTHPKLSSDQGGDNGDSDIEIDDLSESEGEEEEDEYDQLPPFKPLRKSQLAKLNKEQLKAYYEEYDYRVKLLQKKQWKEELKRIKEMKKGKVPESEYLGDDADGAPAAVPVPLPDMVLPPSFDCDNPAYRYRFLEPSSQFLARPVLDNHGWDHDCGYDGVNLEQSLAVAGKFPSAATVQVTKDKKDFSVHLDSSIAAKHGKNASSMAGFDIQNIGKKMAYTVRGETKFTNLKKNKTTAGFSVTFLGENIATGVKLEDQLPIGKRLVLVSSTGTVRSQGDAAYGANLEVKLREADFPIGQDQSSLSLSLVKWRGDLAVGANLQSQISVGRGSNVALRVGLNNKCQGQITIRTSTSGQLQIALVGILPVVLGIYRALMSSDN